MTLAETHAIFIADPSSSIVVWLEHSSNTIAKQGATSDFFLFAFSAGVASSDGFARRSIEHSRTIKITVGKHRRR